MPQGVTGEIIADSLENSWAELHPEYDNLEAAKFDEGKEQEGPVPLAAMVRGDFAAALGVPSATDTPPGSLVVFGDSNFATDRTYGRSYGINLLSNAINFLTRDTEMISIPPKTREDAPYIRMTGSRWAQLLLVSLVGIPGVLFVIGLAVYLRKRNRSIFFWQFLLSWGAPISSPPASGSAPRKRRSFPVASFPRSPRR
jgi:hypothetical protein